MPGFCFEFHEKTRVYEPFRNVPRRSLEGLEKVSRRSLEEILANEKVEKKLVRRSED